MKKFRNLYILFLITAMVLPMGLCFAVPAGAIYDPVILAESAILAETETGKILYANNENAKRAPASLTKLMTAILAVEAYQDGDIALNEVITVDENAFYDLVGEYSTQNIKEGEEMTYEDLLYCALVSSANEACNVIANRVAGDVPSFIRMMNEKALELGCTGTHFENAHGLPDERHYSTAYDLHLIASAAMDMPLISKIVSSTKHVIPATNVSAERELVTTNRLLVKGTPYFYEYATGCKTGYTDDAGYCLASSAIKGDMSLVCIILGAKSVVAEDGTTQIQSFSESKRLLQWGFTSYSYRTLLSTLKLVTEIPVHMGYGADSVVLRPAVDVVSLMDNSVDMSRVELQIELYHETEGKILEAPITIGQPLGKATVTLDGESYGSVELVAVSAVDLNRMEYMRNEVKETLGSKYVKTAFWGLVIFILLYIAFVLWYNYSRKKKKAAANELARKRIEEIRRGETATTGKSFEEIERFFNTRHDEEDKINN